MFEIYSKNVFKLPKNTVLNNPQNAFDITNDGVDTANKAIELCDKLLDRLNSMEKLDKTFTKLEKFHRDNSIEIAQLIRETETLVMNSKDEYFSISQNIYQASTFKSKQIFFSNDLCQL